MLKLGQVLTLKNCIEPFSYASTAYVVASALVSVQPICKNLSNLQKIFGQMVYRLPLAKNSPYAYVVSLSSWPPTWPPWRHVQTRNFKFFKKWYWVRVVIFYCESMSVFVDFSKNFWWSKTSESNGRGRVSFCLPSCRDRELQLLLWKARLRKSVIGRKWLRKWWVCKLIARQF